ncbi:MAG: hypothetical protein Tsb005_06840 [Gammaproteobacteria bacterium]
MNFKLKPLVASLAILVSGSAMAAGLNYGRPEAAPQSSTASKLEQMLNRNQNDRFGQSDWYRRITVSGEINVDVTTSNDTPTDTDRFSSKNSQDISLADANLYLQAEINDWVKANVDLIYNDGDQETRGASNRGVHQLNNHIHRGNDGVEVDEAYLTFANFNQYPWYVRAGREYVRHGDYDRHPITQSFVQQLTQMRADAIELGYVDQIGMNGVSATAFISRGLQELTDSGRRRTQLVSGGAQLGWMWDNGDYGFGLDGSWISNMANVDYIARGLTNYARSVDAFAGAVTGHYRLANGDLNAKVAYVTALNEFRRTDVASEGGNGSAEPSAVDVEVGYDFLMPMPMMNTGKMYKSRFSVGYQHSDEASRIGFGTNTTRVGDGLPEDRWQADFAMMNVLKNVDLGLQVVYDDDYSRADGGTGGSSTTGIFRVSGRFA